MKMTEDRCNSIRTKWWLATLVVVLLPHAGLAEMPKSVEQARSAPEQRRKTSMKLERGTRLSITLASGSLTLRGWEGDSIEADTGDDDASLVSLRTVTDAGIPKALLETRRAGIDLTVRVPKYAEIDSIDLKNGDLDVAEVDGQVKVSAGSGDVRISRVGGLDLILLSGDVSISDVAGAVTLAVHSGDVGLRRVKGNIRVKLTSGDLSIEESGALVDAEMASGDVTVRNAGADVRIKTLSSDILIECARRDVQVNSASGTLMLRAIGRDVDAETVSGDVSLEGTIRPEGRYRLKTLSGNTSMLLPPDPPGFTATLVAYSGELINEFQLKIQTPAGRIDKKMIGTYGDGRAQITLDTFNGSVRLGKGPAASNQCK
jgi:DUF4097 and DUF4098 domain-containing protein YvlB